MEVSARLRREIAAVDDLFALVERFVTDENLELRIGFQIAIALEELFTNAVRHNPDGSGELRVVLSRDGKEIVASFTDFDADPFDPSAAAPPDLSRPLDQRRPGGLGVHFVRRVMDRVDYDWRDRESTVTLTKKLG